MTDGGKPKPKFVEWLRAMADVANASSPAELQHLLLANNCHCTLEQATEWLQGTGEPTFDKTRDIIKAFYAALPGVEVWEEYRNFTLGKPFLQDVDKKSAALEEKLEDILRGSGLPPPLSDE
ncbi:MAG: hypothetical protein ACRDIU_09360 [Actinomycetota bacterium]